MCLYEISDLSFSRVSAKQSWLAIYQINLQYNNKCWSRPSCGNYSFYFSFYTYILCVLYRNVLFLLLNPFKKTILRITLGFAFPNASYSSSHWVIMKRKFYSGLSLSFWSTHITDTSENGSKMMRNLITTASCSQHHFFKVVITILVLRSLQHFRYPKQEVFFQYSWSLFHYKIL